MSLPSLRWLQIHRYEQFEPVRIEFSGQENLVLGINGAGKTRLLRLIRAVLSLDFGELRDQVFDVEFELESVTALDRHVRVRVGGRVRSDVIAQDDAPGQYPNMMGQRTMTLNAVLWFEVNGKRISSELRDGQITLVGGPGDVPEILPHDGQGLLVWPSRFARRGDVASAMRAMYPLCESVMISEADQEFEILTGEVQYSVNGSLPRGREIVIDPPERLTHLLRRDLYPLLFQLGFDMNRNGGSADLPSAPFMFGRAIEGREKIHEQLLVRIQAAIGATQLRLVPKIVREKDELVECRGLGLRVSFTDGTEVVESELTFGQRRYLYTGLMLLSHPGEPILIDEVDNGLHPRLVETLLQLLADRQSFLASHNKIVIDYTNFDGPEDVQRKVHIVQRGKDGRQSVLVLDDETARTVYEKISVAIQSPSDVLLAEGLW